MNLPDLINKCSSFIEFSGICEWVQASNGAVPAGACPSGRPINGEVCYEGRVPIGNGQFAYGKVFPSRNGLVIINKGQEKIVSNYQVLVK